MTTITGSVSLAGILAELQEEVARTKGDAKPAPMQDGDKIIGQVADNDEAKALFALRAKYAAQARRNAIAFGLTGSLPYGVSDEEAVAISFKKVVYDELFWNLARKLTGQYGPFIGVREGFVMVEPKIERPSGLTGPASMSAAMQQALEGKVN